MFDRHGPELELESGVPIAALRLLEALPSYYVHYYYQHDAEVALQSRPGHRSRAEVVAELEAKLLDEYRNPEFGDQAGGSFLPGGCVLLIGGVRLMASLHADTGDIQVVDMRNDGAIPGLPDEAVVELPAVVDAGGATRSLSVPFRPKCWIVHHAKAYEHLAVGAGRSGSRDHVVRALLANLVGQYPLAAELADELPAANRHYLRVSFPTNERREKVGLSGVVGRRGGRSRSRGAGGGR